jgi:hypothetical protein
MKHFWRVATINEPDTQRMLSQSVLDGRPSLIQKLRPDHGLLLSDWDADNEVGHVIALGIVRSVNVIDAAASVVWCRSSITLRPNPSGRRYWRDNPHFRFADDVAVRYMLEDLFAENFPPEDEGSASMPTEGPRSPDSPTPGFVYVLRSGHGYKIGKTINLKARTQMFAVKLPFPTTLEHYAWFDDYSKAESDFHAQFANKRLEGEWFDLSCADLTKIRKHGTPIQVEGL